jgi:hypothetical protein
MFESSNLDDLIIYLWPEHRQLTLKNKFKFFFIYKKPYLYMYLFYFKKNHTILKLTTFDSG